MMIYDVYEPLLVRSVKRDVLLDAYKSSVPSAMVYSGVTLEEG